jgi:uncharacterized protein (TIGR02145 family)
VISVINPILGIMKKHAFYLLLTLFLSACGTENVPVYDFSASSLPAEGGIVNPSSGQYSEGDLIQVRATPSQGWEFVRWEGDVTQESNPVSIRFQGDVRISAVFQQMEAVEVVTNPATGRTWMDRNLGASRVAISPTDSLAYGWLFQWGREADQHQLRNSALVSTLSSSDRPRITSFILAPNDPFDWRSPQNSNLWQGANGTNNPCPAGFRIPTETEWEEERQTWGTNDVIGAFGSVLKLTVGGRRNFSAGVFFDVNEFGYYWTSTTEGSFTKGLGIFNNSASMFSYNRAGGNSVRCIKD